MILQLSEIMTAKEKTKHMEAPLELESVSLGDECYSVVEKSKAELFFTVLGGKKLLMEVKARVVLRVPCDRCLEEVNLPFDISLSKELDFNDSDADRIKELDELNYIDGYNLDLDLLIFDEILIGFPLQVVCSADCKGICSVCGTNLNKETCECDTFVGDPRMSVIQDIFKNSYQES
jgi:uncharacterized protein